MFVAMPLLALVVDLGISRSAGAQAATAAEALRWPPPSLAATPPDPAGAAAVARQLVQDDFAV